MVFEKIVSLRSIYKFKLLHPNVDDDSYLATQKDNYRRQTFKSEV